MSTSSRFPSPEGDAAGTTSPSELPSPRKRFVPPGCEFITTVTSCGYQPGQPSSAYNCKCQNHRQRYPDAEAILQMIFRACAIILNVSVLVILGILGTNPYTDMAARKFYGAIAYSLFLNTIEIISLCNLQPTLLIHHFPWVFCARGSTYSPMLQTRFPRLPSAYLAVCECAAVFAGIWNATLFVNSALEDRTWDFECPADMCLAPQVYRMISGYILEVVIGLFHIGFFFMAVGHLVKRKTDGWLRALEK